jgi:hypothetical protein
MDIHEKRLQAEKQRSTRMHNYTHTTPVKRYTAAEARHASYAPNDVDYMIDWVYKEIHMACEKRQQYAVFYIEHKGHIFSGKTKLLREVSHFFDSKGYSTFKDARNFVIHWGLRAEFDELIKNLEANPLALHDKIGGSL